MKLDGWKNDKEVQRLLSSEFFFMFIKKIRQKYGFFFVIKNILTIKFIYENLVAVAFYYNFLNDLNVWLRNKHKKSSSKINFNTLKTLAQKFSEGRAYPYRTIMFNIIE